MESLSSIIITVISGVLVYIIGQILKEIWLTPLQEYKELKSKISFSLSYYAQYYSNVVDLATCGEETKKIYKNASDEMRKISCELDGFIETLSWFKPCIPQKKKLYEASREIMGISNSFFCPYNTNKTGIVINHNIKARDSIYKLLKIYALK